MLLLFASQFAWSVLERNKTSIPLVAEGELLSLRYHALCGSCNKSRAGREREIKRGGKGNVREVETASDGLRWNNAPLAKTDVCVCSIELVTPRRTAVPVSCEGLFVEHPWCTPCMGEKPVMTLYERVYSFTAEDDSSIQGMVTPFVDVQHFFSTYLLSHANT